MRGLSSSAFPKLKTTEVQFLSKQITDEEIRITLFDMVLLKAPGIDEFHALFFQNQWDHIGNTICNWVKLVFAGKAIDPDLNNTLIVLIPKVHDHESFSQFLPISLCLVIY